MKPTTLLTLLLLAACGPKRGTVSETCVTLLECVATVASESNAATNEAYGAESDCWTSPEGGDSCTAECAATLEEYHGAHPTEPACDTGNELGSNVMFPSGAGFTFQSQVHNGQCDDEVGVTLVELSLTSAVTPTFTWSGEISGAWGNTPFNIAYFSECELSETDWTCLEDPVSEEVEELLVERFTFAGTFSADGTSATATLGYDLTDDTGTCTQTQMMSGAQ